MSARIGLRAYLLIPALAAGCAARNEYVKPEVAKPVYSSGVSARAAGDPLVIQRTRSSVWRLLISGVGKTGFVVDGANQNTWTVQLRYTGDPKDYINCGRVISPVKTAKGERNYDFPAAKAYQQYELQQGTKLYLVDRRMNLEVRTDVVLEQAELSGTRIKLDPRYTVTRDQAVQGGGGKPFGVTDKVSFGSADGATFPTAATRCQATGGFERDVLELLKR